MTHSDPPIKHIPKLFNPAMVDALLRGRKTETRRVPDFKFLDGRNPDFTKYTPVNEGGRKWCLYGGNGQATEYIAGLVPGDLIWVKEAHWAHGFWRDGDGVTKTGKQKREFFRTPSKAVLFDEPDTFMTGPNHNSIGWHKRSSLFMEKADSRMTLRVTSFGIERLREIDEAGAIAEGIYETWPGRWDFCRNETCFKSPVFAYADLWNSIHGPGAWDANPWVTVTKFEVNKRNILEMGDSA